MLKEKFEYLGINPEIIRKYLEENAVICKTVNNDLAKYLDPIASCRNELILVQTELLIAYLS